MVKRGFAGRAGSPWWTILVGCWVAILVTWVAPFECHSQVAGRPTASYPNISYYAAFEAYHDGDYKRALDGFRGASRTGLRSVNGAWVDAVCYRTMIGECYYRMGDLKAALEHYNSSLQLFLLNRQWMTRVQFPSSIRPFTRTIRPPVTWTAGTRPAKLGQIPEKFQILFGNLNNDAVIQQGGVVARAEFHTANVHEIVRCTALALRRRYELIGAVGEFDTLNARLLAAYDSQLGPANHWSQAWINVQRGYALAGAGKFDEAISSFRASVTLAGQYDHPLTSTALLGLGQMAVEKGDLNSAAKLFVDASVSAAIFEQYTYVEDAFTMATDAALANPSDQSLPLALAADWAKRSRKRHLHATLATLAAETMAFSKQPGPAAKLLTRARQSLDRRATMARRLEARFEYVAAHTSYQQRKLPAAQAAMNRAVNLQRMVSPWLYQIGMTDNLYRLRNGQLTDRGAGMLFERLLREPTKLDWTLQPLDTLAYILSPNQQAYEHWFEIVLERGEAEKALEVGDRMKRQRFYAQLPLGGRLVSFRWILEAPESQLNAMQIELRNDLLTRYPGMKELAVLQRRLRNEIGASPFSELPQEENERQKDLARQLDDVIKEQEALLGEIALRREDCPFVFPPLATANEIQETLQDHQFALIYVATSRATYAFLLSGDTYTGWDLPRAQQVRRDSARFLTRIGLTNENATISIEDMQDAAWQDMGRQVLRQLIGRAHYGFWKDCEELIIVPDGLLWYVPFESMPTNEKGEDYVPLIARTRVRYLPTAGLICQPTHPRLRNPRTAVVAGKLFPRDSVDDTITQISDLQEIVKGLEILPRRLPGSSGLLRTVWDRLIVFDDVPDAREGLLTWSPVRIDEGKPGSSLARWLTLPWGAPRMVLLPGFHTATESGLKQSVSGNELFLTSLSFLAAGCDTVLLSRWRTGGASAYDLVREFLQEEPHGTPAAAWQRSVQILRETEFDPDWEPRVSQDKQATPVSADHPFLWAGYMLLDLRGSERADAPELGDGMELRAANKN